MKAIKARVVWTPARGVFANSDTAGKVAVTEIPEAPELKAHPKSYGASDLDWRETTNEGRQLRLQRLFNDIVQRDLVPEAAVREALSVIEDLNVNGLYLEDDYKPFGEDEDED